MSPLDLSAEENVKEYLSNTSFAGVDIVRLSGGNVGNDTFRIRLQNPYQGHKSVVLKHAKDFKNIPLTAKRQELEFEALKFVRAWYGDKGIVSVPAVLHYDELANVLILEDCGDDLPTLKTFLRETTPSPELATHIGRALGEFLAALHSHPDAAVHTALDSNAYQQAKDITHWAYYTRLVPTLTGADPAEPLMNPPLEVKANDLKAIEGHVDDMLGRITKDSHTVFTHGDFWTGNVMVKTSHDGRELEKIFVVDWELAKPGLRALDVGQFCAEVHTVRRFDPGRGDAVEALLQGFWHEYSQKTADMLQEAESLKDVALRRVGAHLVSVTPRVGWGTKERTREVVLEGVELLMQRSTEHELTKLMYQ